MINVAVVGATGYTGFELIKFLSRHSGVKISAITSDTSKGKRISEIYPSLRSVCDATLVPNDYDEISKSVDAVFLCLPHGASQQAGAFFNKKGKIVIDLSADFRISDVGIYEAVYKTKHNETETLKKAVYGIPEIFFREIKETIFIANPGCYATSVIMPLYPLLKSDVVKKDFIVADAKSGVSGAGKTPSEKTHFCEVNEDFKPYGIFSHRHNPEIDFILSKSSPSTHVVFTPHLLPVNRGIETTIYFKKNGNSDIKKILSDFYRGKFFVRLRDDDSVPSIKDVVYTNFIDLNVYEKGEDVIIVSCIDNLVKGASGQAVQNFNILCGFDETESLI
mgnify:CR=1 FL=1